MSMILLFDHYEARWFSDETCFKCEIYLLLDHSKMMVFINPLNKNNLRDFFTDE